MGKNKKARFKKEKMMRKIGGLRNDDSEKLLSDDSEFQDILKKYNVKPKCTTQKCLGRGHRGLLNGQYNICSCVREELRKAMIEQNQKEIDANQEEKKDEIQS